MLKKIATFKYESILQSFFGKGSIKVCIKALEKKQKC